MHKVEQAPILFHVSGDGDACCSPVRCGDLLRIKNLGYGWVHEGKVVMVIDVVRSVLSSYHALANMFDECEVIMDGEVRIVRIEYLESLSAWTEDRT